MNFIIEPGSLADIDELERLYDELNDHLSATINYPGGKSKFYSLFEDIDCAESHIHIFYYAIGDDHIGNELKEKIINKVKQGIKVRLLYDGLGCNKTNRKYFKQMIEAGVEVKTFLPLSFPRFLRSVNYRNHKKIVIIDGRIAYTGGINVKDVYIDGLPWGKWNDIHFKVEIGRAHV